MRDRKSPSYTASVLSLGGLERLLVAGVLIALIWVAVAWALW